MENKKERIALITISVIVLAAFLRFDIFLPLFSDCVMSVKVISENRLSEMIAGKEFRETGNGLKFDNHPIAYDVASNTYFIPQSLSENHWEGFLAADTGKLYFTDDGYLREKGRAIGEGHVFKLYCLEHSGYFEYNIVFTGMPVLSLFEGDSSLEDGEKVMHGMVLIYDQYSATTNFRSAECDFHVRGGTSYGYEKKSYKLEFHNKNISLLGMRSDDDWILNALYDDAGLIHNKISAQVWKEIASSNHVQNDEGFSLEYVELFLNNEYRGVYALTERVDKKELSLGKNDILYKCRAYRIPEEHNYTNNMTDGMDPIFLLKYPKDFCEDDWKPIKNWVDLFLKGNMDIYEDGASVLNMENAVDANLFCMLIGGTDNMRKNNFFIAEHQQDGAYRIKKVPWDMNASWGNPWVDIAECNYTKYDPEYYKNVSAWISDINTLYYYDRERVAGLLCGRWEELRKEGIISKEKIFEMLDREYGYLYSSGAYKRNYERWPGGTEFWSDEFIYDYAEQRIDFLDGYYRMLYEDCVSPKIYDGVDYSAEFDTRYYWEENKEVLEELYPYDTQMLLEHYVLYGKPFGLKARYDGGVTPGTIVD